MTSTPAAAALPHISQATIAQHRRDYRRDGAVCLRGRGGGVRGRAPWAPIDTGMDSVLLGGAVLLGG